MPGTDRRYKPLKGATRFDELSDTSIASPATGDLLSYIAGAWGNTKALTGDYTITGTVTAEDLIVTDDLTVGDDLIVTGLATIGESLGISGTATIQGAATLASTLAVNGAVTLSDTLSVTGNFTGAGFSVSGNGAVGGTLSVTATASFAAAISADSATLAGALLVGGALQANTATILDALVVDGSILGAGVASSGSISAIGLLDVGGTATIRDDLSVLNGNIALQQAAGVDTVLAFLEGPATKVRQTWDASAGTFILDLAEDSARISVSSLSSASAARTLLTLDPDGELTAYYDGSPVLKTSSTGIGLAPITGGVNPRFSLWDAGFATELTRVVFNEAANVLYIRSEVDSARVQLRSLNASSVVAIGLDIDPDGTTDLYGSGTKNLEVGASTLGFLGTAGIAKPTVTGSRGANAALASLLSALASYGLITDSST